MPIIKSAKKRVRTAEKAAIRNSKTKRSLKTALKTFHKAASGSAKLSADIQSEAQSAIDIAVKKGLIHKNKAARQKAQLAKAAKAAGAPKPTAKAKTAKPQVIEKLKAASNVLVTVNANPSVDQLAACIGLTLLLNKLDKHATAVFSGKVPSTIEFLKPEETLEKTTDSLRDFIISLDKTKADKLRYKVEDTVVKIFITPYRSSITEKDLVFSQGDFNVDVVLALGVHLQDDLDEAIVAHGRILHDAVVIGINNTPNTQVGTINWLDESASSLSEMVASLPHEFAEGLLDEQIATALLTGVVAETNHFSNSKTTPQTMSISASLLTAGANQQLVANELNELLQGQGTPAPTKSDEGSKEPAGDAVEINHDKEKPAAEVPKQGGVSDVKAYGAELDGTHPKPLAEEHMVMTPPVYGAAPKAVQGADVYDPAIDMSGKPKPPAPLLQREDPQTLSDLEAAVHSNHESADAEVDSARQAVDEALQDSPNPLEPLVALNAQPVDLNIRHEPVSNQTMVPQPDGVLGPHAFPEPPVNQPAQPLPSWMTPAPTPQPPVEAPKPAAYNPAINEPAPLEMSPADQPYTMPLPPAASMNPQVITPAEAEIAPEGPLPPPVPPPLMPPSPGN